MSNLLWGPYIERLSRSLQQKLQQSITFLHVLCPFPTDTMPSTPYHCKYVKLSMHAQDVCTVYLFSIPYRLRCWAFQQWFTDVVKARTFQQWFTNVVKARTTRSDTIKLCLDILHKSSNDVIILCWDKHEQPLWYRLMQEWTTGTLHHFFPPNYDEY